MAVQEFDFTKTQPATGGQRRDYITPGKYTFKVIKYDDKDSAAGKTMHSFTSQVMTGKEKGKKITDRFAMPKSARDSQYPKERLLAFFIACGADVMGKRFKIDPTRFVGKTFEAEVYDQREEERVVDGRTYAARNVSALQYSIAEDEEEDEEDEEDEDLDEEDEDEEEDEEDEEDEDEEEDEDDEDDEEEEEEEPAPVARRRGRPAATATKSKPAAKPAAKAKTKSKAAAAKPARKSRKSDDDDFPFDD